MYDLGALSLIESLFIDIYLKYSHRWLYNCKSFTITFIV